MSSSDARPSGDARPTGPPRPGEESRPSGDARAATDAAALAYHRFPRPGKLEIRATKPLGTQRDLSLAYSPGVAAPCLAIAADPDTARDYTGRANIVAVVTNGTAVLGLGAIGALAAKPVMEGKAVLFKKFADIDGIDIEIDERDPKRFVEVVAALEPSFGGINLEDIAAPACFEIEAALKARMKIPVFHDDQHGTAIIVAAAIQNALHLAGKRLDRVKIVTSGAGAAALSCLNLLVALGARLENIFVTDIDGVVHAGRTVGMDPWKAVYARQTEARSLGEVIDGADVFLGLSAAGVLKPAMVERMAERALILALANPVPEIMPDEARAVRPDAMICTGRSDYPNQVNNVLCFPYLFRGALDVAATAINEEMKAAAAAAIAALARERPTEEVARAYGGDSRLFGPDYLIPAPFDPRLVLRIAPAVAKAAMETGVALRPIEDLARYEEDLKRLVFRTVAVMRPLVSRARGHGAVRIAYAEGEDERVLRAAVQVVDERIATPVLIGRPRVIEARAARAGLKELLSHVEIINPEDDPRYRDYVDLYFGLLGRRGVTPDAARTVVRTNTTVIAALAVRRGEADAMICGIQTPFSGHLEDIENVIGVREGVTGLSALTAVITDQTALFFVDTHVREAPTAAHIAESTMLAAQEVRRFGIAPKVALLSASRFGSRRIATAETMRQAVQLLWERAPDLEVDGEMQAEDALSPAIRQRWMPDSRLDGAANLLVFPTLDAANIAVSLVREVTGGIQIGPILLGTALPAHVLTTSVTGRGIYNMSTLVAVEVTARKEAGPAPSAFAAAVAPPAAPRID